MTMFHEDLFGCLSDIKVFLFGLLVPGGLCCLQSKAVNKVTGNGVMVPYLFLVSFYCIGGAINREQIRETYGIKGSLLRDSLIWLVFPGCAACQEYREVHNHS